MSLCHLMILDFTQGTGRFDPDRPHVELYDDYDLARGQQYALDLIEAGYDKDPVDSFDLKRFAVWCDEQLHHLQSKSRQVIPCRRRHRS